MLNYDLLPINLRDGMKLYIEKGIKPGSFLTACLANDLVGAMGRASSATWNYLFSVASFLYNELPARSDTSPWGSYEAVERYSRARLTTTEVPDGR